MPAVAPTNPYSGNLVSVQPQSDSGAYISYNSGIQQNIHQIGMGVSIAPYGRRGYRGGQRFKPYNVGSRIDPTLCSLLVKNF